jgi:hypothetical protein
MTLDSIIGRFYTVHYFHALARLDLPTFEDMAVQHQLQKVLPQTSRSIVWQMIMAISSASFKSLTLISQVIVLISVVREQSDGPLLAILCLIYSVMSLFVQTQFIYPSCGTPRSFGTWFGSHLTTFTFSMGRNHKRYALYQDGGSEANGE